MAYVNPEGSSQRGFALPVGVVFAGDENGRMKRLASLRCAGRSEEFNNLVVPVSRCQLLRRHSR